MRLRRGVGLALRSRRLPLGGAGGLVGVVPTAFGGLMGSPTGGHETRHCFARAEAAKR